MGTNLFRACTDARNVLFLVLVVFLLKTSTGCQLQRPVATHVLVSQQHTLDRAGLMPPEILEDLAVLGAMPQDWERLKAPRSSMFSHHQWRSPSSGTGVGVAYIRMPFPLPTSTILWFARSEYTKRQQGEGRLLGQWTDTAGRHWFEAQNQTYHVHGYAMTRGREAWIIYSGYRLGQPLQPWELSLAHRALQSVVPAN
jgi:hypothetical protein